ncbi:ABC transporter substrate-binding protein [Psychrobacter phenylpyruvicus]|uniref:Putrescine-binding periplasmic protein n=1 Tax=Psychrobacter phenylpyruvicus TaxID=29432 RepID=A0A379LJF1_9GAMM|nr:spermidine/putrescine ABC transporter substrate-binding protein [Psychrobacter phenylpyruvicus]SUD90678.1 Spermidine/putrescine-binding periplasmic protein precursor [Psychrobacter phenylpyruvicus]
MSNNKFLTRRRFLEMTGAGLAALSGVSALSGCQPNSSSTDVDGDSAGAVSSSGKNVVNVYNWTEYISDDVLKAFTKETGIDVVYSTFDSNEAMYAKLKLMGNSGNYDVIFPGTDFVDKMRKENMLEVIDHNKLSNFKHLNKSFLDVDFDPENKFSVPYLWGSSGIGVNTKRIDLSSITSWDDLWLPEYKGRVMLMNDLRDVFALGLLTLDLPVATQDPKHIKAAYEKLTKMMPNVRTFNSDAPRMPFLEGETYLGMVWNGEVIMAQDQGMPELDFVYPKEGAIMWMDNMSIPKNAKNLENAYAFIDFLLRPDNSAIISEEIGYGSPSDAAKALMPPEMANNKIIYPPEDLLGHALFRQDVSDKTMALYQQYWDRLKVDM